MLHPDSHSDWFLLPPEAPQGASFRKSNRIAIVVLVFFTLGVFVIGLGRADGHAHDRNQPASMASGTASAPSARP